MAELPGGGIVAVVPQRNIFLPEGERRDTTPLLFVRSGLVDTLGVWMGLERAFAALPGGRGSALVPIGFARTTYATSNGTRTVIGSSDSLDLAVFDASLRPVLRIRGSEAPRPASERDVRRWRDELADLLEGMPETDFLAAAWADAPVLETLPAFDGLQVDPSNRLWVGTYVVHSDAHPWVVFDSLGVPLARVRLPAVRRGPYPGSTELLAVGRDRVAILQRTRFDEEYVEVRLLSGPHS